MELIEIRKKLKKVQDKDRYEHTKGVMYTAKPPRYGVRL